MKNLLLITLIFILFNSIFSQYISATGSNFRQTIYPITECNDGIDNDGDGGIDFATDAQCVSWIDRSETILDSQCSDGVDNDNDGFIDFPDDPECSSLADNTENLIDQQCNDGIDNDSDGLIDFPNDPECSSINDNTENIIEFQCNDGVDNDGDGLIDFPQDTGCVDLNDNDETNPNQPIPPSENKPNNNLNNFIKENIVKPIEDAVDEINIAVGEIVFKWTPLGNILGVESYSEFNSLPVEQKTPIVLFIPITFGLSILLIIIVTNIIIRLVSKIKNIVNEKYSF